MLPDGKQIRIQDKETILRDKKANLIFGKTKYIL